jgi:hypothetical protein
MIEDAVVLTLVRQGWYFANFYVNDQIKKIHIILSTLK